MAEAVVSMARSMLGGAINMAASAAAKEMSLVMGVQKDIWFIKDELKTMQAFLVAAEAMKNRDMLLKVWAEQVRDLSYNIEDCLEEFMVHVRSQSLMKRLMNLKDRRRIATQIRNLKSRVEEVSSRNASYNLIKTEASTTSDKEVSYVEDVRNHSASNTDEVEWEHFYNQLPSELESNPSLEAMKMMVTLSYNHLPSHLKPCLLYLIIFPEDLEIKKRRLVERWIADGLIRGGTGVNIEDVAKGYLNELINRSMLQPSRVNIEGVVKSCRVHDIVRDVMISVSSDENFMYVAGNNVTGVMEETFRHVAYHGSMCQKIDMDWSHVRSVTVFGERSLGPSPSVCSPDMRMLRALDLENAQFQVTQKDIGNIGLFRHLKYVNFSDPGGYSHIYKLPRSIGKLQGLRTLNIKDSYITELPTEISKIKTLHSLRCTRKKYYDWYDLDFPKECLVHTLCLPMQYSERAKVVAELHMAWSSRWSKSYGVRVPKGIGNLKELQILEVVDISQTSCKAIKELGELVQLRKLSVVTEGVTKEKCKVLCDAIQKLTCLRSLQVDGALEWLHVVSSPPPLLRSLNLYGCLGEIPGWVGSLMHLVKLYLRGSEIKEEGNIMEILGPLPNLMQLRLQEFSYIGEKLALKTGAFPNLKKLEIESLDQLREVRFEVGTSPQLAMIDISWCKLESGIIGVNQLSKLKEISLGSHARVAKLAMLQSEVDAHPNSPVLRLYKERSHHDLGDDVVQVEEGTDESSSPHPEPAAARESTRSHALVTTNVSQDDLLYTYNSC